MELLYLVLALAYMAHRSLSSTFNLSVAITDTALMQCKIDIVPSVNTVVVWTGPGDQIISADGDLKTADRRFQVSTPHRQQYDVKIARVKAGDEGEYVCGVMSGANRLSYHTFYLSVQFPPSMLTAQTTEHVLNEGDTVSLSCEAKGVPTPTLTWIFMDPDLPGIEADVETETPELLTLSQLNLTSNGLYVCVADNGVAPPDKSEYVIVVKASPKIQVPYVKVTQETGEDLMLQCVVHWKPIGEVQWTFDGRPVVSTKDSPKGSKQMRQFYENKANFKSGKRNKNNGDEGKYRIIVHKVTSKTSIVGLLIEDFSRSDIGRYKCIANNELGSSEAEIIALGHESSSSKEITVVVGDDAVIACSHTMQENEQDADVVWSRRVSSMDAFERVDVAADERVGSLQVLKNKELKIHSVQMADSGFYRCSLARKDSEADDEAGDDDEAVYLSVTHTSASSGLTSKEGFVSVETLCIILAAVMAIMAVVFAAVLYVLLRVKSKRSFNVHEHARFKG